MEEDKKAMDITSVSASTGYDYNPPAHCSHCGSADESASSKESTSSQKLSKEEQQEVQELKSRDQEVRAHEMAHIAAGGQYVRGGASFEYQTGPDGKRYAVGGEVSIDTSSVSGDPEATIQKMRVVRSAALAPAKPSSQDRSVAAQAAQKENKARQEMVKEQKEAMQESTEESSEKALGSDSEKTKGYSKEGIRIPNKNSSPNDSLNILA